jgi:hypothetical protein
MIYTICGKSTPFRASRCFGYFLTEDEAYANVENNSGDFNEEGYYDLIIVERFKPGVFPVGEVLRWYRFEIDKWIQIDPPKEYERIVNWALG